MKLTTPEYQESGNNPFDDLVRPLGWEVVSAGRYRCPGEHSTNEQAGAYQDDEGEWRLTIFSPNVPTLNPFKPKVPYDIDELKYILYGELSAERPTITIDARTDLYTMKAEKALARHANVFTNGSVLGRLVEDSKMPPLSISIPKTPQFLPHTAATILLASTQVADFQKLTKDGPKPCEPPDRLGRILIDLQSYPTVNRFEGIVGVIQLLSNNTFLTEPGYHAESGLWMIGKWNRPNMALEEAKKIINTVFDEFQWGHEAAKSAAIAAVLTTMCRHAIQGCVPLCHIEANQAGVGKTYLADVITTIAVGEPCGKSNTPESDEEVRKSITSILLRGAPFAILDNAKTLKYRSLLVALTTRSLRDRILGVSKEVELPVRTIFFSTGRNTTFSREMARRTNFIHLNSREDRPEHKRFKNSDLIGWIKSNRATVVEAFATLVSEFIKAGRPKQDIPPLGTFQEWSDIVRQSVIFAGYPDPLNTHEQLAQRIDEDTNEDLGALLDAWEEASAGKPLTVAEAIATEAPLLCGITSQLKGDPKHALGIMLRKYRGANFGLRHLESEGKPSKWFVATDVADAA